MQRLDWLVVADIFLTETAEVWKAPGTDPKNVKTEVFFLPMAPAAEKDGSLTNTMRLIQWHEAAVKPPGDCSSDAALIVRLAHRLQKLYAGSKKHRDQGFLAANFTYGDNADEPDMQLVLKEISGFATQEIKNPDGTVQYKKGQAVSTFAHLKDDGSTAAGCWIYTGVINETPDGKLINKAASRKPATAEDYLGHGWGFAWPANRRIIYNRAAADLQGKPWSEKKKLVWWDPEAAGASPDKKGKWVGLDVPDFNPVLAPDAKNGDKPFIMRADLVGALFGPLVDGPFPEHYEPIESPVKNLLSTRQNNPVAKIWTVPDQKNELAPVGSPDYPYVITTYRLTEHHLSGVMSRYLPMLAELHFAHFTEISHELAKELGIQNGDMVTVTSPRGKIHVKAMVTNRLKPFMLDGKTIHQIGVPPTGATTGSRGCRAARVTSRTTSRRRWATRRSSSRRPRRSSATSRRGWCSHGAHARDVHGYVAVHRMPRLPGGVQAVERAGRRAAGVDGWLPEPRALHRQDLSARAVHRGAEADR
jgi:formate dehydrogenase major subunit